MLSPTKSLVGTANTGNQNKKSKVKMSVARRLHLMQSPTSSVTQNITHDSILVAENDKVEQEVQAARDELLKAQQEASMAKKRLEAEEARRKALMLRKQIKHDTKKVKQERARYE